MSVCSSLLRQLLLLCGPGAARTSSFAQRPSRPYTASQMRSRDGYGEASSTAQGRVASWDGITLCGLLSPTALAGLGLPRLGEDLSGGRHAPLQLALEAFGPTCASCQCHRLPLSTKSTGPSTMSDLQGSRSTAWLDSAQLKACVAGIRSDSRPRLHLPLHLIPRLRLLLACCSTARRLLLLLLLVLLRTFATGNFRASQLSKPVQLPSTCLPKRGGGLARARSARRPPLVPGSGRDDLPPSAGQDHSYTTLQHYSTSPLTP